MYSVCYLKYIGMTQLNCFSKADDKWPVDEIKTGNLQPETNLLQKIRAGSTVRRTRFWFFFVTFRHEIFEGVNLLAKIMWTEKNKGGATHAKAGFALGAEVARASPAEDCTSQ